MITKQSDKKLQQSRNFESHSFGIKESGLSHIFNVLDARGAISVAQRAEYIGRIREITKSAAAIWIDTQI